MSTPISDPSAPPRIILPPGASTAILTDAETRAAEAALFADGIAPATLMEIAGAAVADVAAARAGHGDVLVACGPGNNGGDGYVVARLLRERGVATRVAAIGEPRTEAAALARRRWSGPVTGMDGEPTPAGLLIDAVFGSGQSRPVAANLVAWLRASGPARVVVADVPTGVRTDTGEGEMAVGGARVAVVALGALKPAHLLGQAAARADELILAPLGLPLPAEPALRLLRPSRLRGPDAAANKYSRGKVVIVGGAMPGAAHLAAGSAQRAGAGYVELMSDHAVVGPPWSLVVRGWSPDALDDPRIGAIAIGPGLVDGADSRARLSRVLAVPRPAVLDAGALAILATVGLDTLRDAPAPRVLTPHDGEFERLFGPVGRDRIAAARAAAAQSGAVIVLKGHATVVAAPNGRALVAPPASPWLASAGTGDVLTGIVATMLAQACWHGLDTLAAVGQAVRLHARAAALAGPALIADDLVANLPHALCEPA